MEKQYLTPYVYQELPAKIISSRVKGEIFMKQFLQNHVPSHDIRTVAKNWRFLLEKHQIAKKPKRKQLKKTFLTRAEKVDLNLLKLPKEGWNYNKLEPIRQMWKEYMIDNLELINKEKEVSMKRVPKCDDSEWPNFSTILSKSELVGAETTVVRSKIPTQVGLSGTIVLETKQTLQIVTPKNQLKIIVKDSSVFEIILGDIKLTIFGKHITTRPSEKSVKKIKTFMYPDL
ncbi:uncharacterized protein LOC109600904 [Aethina tumida]|uniref:uncharacterized protein LOC109600904 n=1 Tax=Aethina tumida TaxID=116153 RepID=UPI00214880CE|nr:uncharacterized protein LOC109600904 [Aethina tumida]